MKGEHRRNFVKLLQQAARKTNLWDVFSDFLHVAATAISNSDRWHLATDVKTWQQREDEYLAVIKKYDKEEQQLFPQMLAELTLEMDDCVSDGHFEDVLGSVFHELELHNKWRGQFFTPQDISDFMGKIVVDNNEKGSQLRQDIDLYGFCSINEPCCGAGAMLYGFLNAFREAGFNHSKQVLITACDLDERCVWMTYIQCSLYGTPAIVLQQNTLSLETFGKPWYSPVYVVDGWQWKRRRAHDIELQEREYRDFLEILG